MTKKLIPRDWEAISGYIDDELSPKDRARFEARLKSEPDLRHLLEDMRRTRSLVRGLDPVRAPRNFTLTPAMAGIRPRPYWPVPTFQWASAIATLLFILVVAGDLLGFLGSRGPMVTSPALVESAPGIEAFEEFASTPEEAAGTERLEAEGGLPAQEEFALEAVEAPPGGEASIGAAGTPESADAGGESTLISPLPPEVQEKGAPLAADEVSPEEADARERGVLGILAEGNLNLRILEAVLALLALITALVAMVFRRRSA